MVTKIEKLEARVLLDGSLSAIDVDYDEAISAFSDAQSDKNQSVLNTIALFENELFVIDANLKDVQSFLDRIPEGADVLTIAPHESGLNKARDFLKRENKIFSAVHIISHGSHNQFTIGVDIVSDETAIDQKSLWEAIGNSLGEQGDILIYACDFAADDDGKATLSLLSQIVGADFAASDDITGASGDWELEVSTGVIEAKGFEFREYQNNLANSPPSILVPGLLSGAEGDFITGLTVDAANSDLMERVNDPDSNDTVFTIATVNGEPDLTTAKTVFTSFSDKDNLQQNIRFELSVKEDGSYTLKAASQADLDLLERIPNHRVATGTFEYQIADTQGARSEKVLGLIQIAGTNDGPVLAEGAVLNISENSLVIGGRDVDVGQNALLSRASDIDDAMHRLSISEINGDTALVDNVFVVELIYDDHNGSPATQDIAIAVRADGSVDIDPQNIQQLGLGGIATGTFTYKVSDASGALSAEQTATINLVGTNDQPQFRGDVRANISAAPNNPTVSGEIIVDDIDQGENTFQIPSVTESNYGTWSFDNTAGIWSFTLNSEHLDIVALQPDEKLLDSITVTSQDGTVDRDIIVEIFGAGSAPSFSVEANDAVNLSIAEGNGTIFGVGTLTLKDVNTFENVSVSVSNVSASGSTVGLTLSQRELASLLRLPELPVLDELTNQAQFNWVFDSGKDAFDYLSAGETLTLSYTIKAQDDRYLEATQSVVVNISGSNDVFAVRAIDQVRNHSQGLIEIDLQGMVDDPDINDSLTFTNLVLYYPDGAPAIDGGVKGVSQNGLLSFDAGLFGELVEGVEKRIQVNVDVSDGEVTKTLSFYVTIEGGEYQARPKPSLPDVPHAYMIGSDPNNPMQVYNLSASVDGTFFTRDFYIDPTKHGEVLFEIDFKQIYDDILDDPTLQSYFPSDIDLQSMLTIKTLGNGNYRFVFDSGQHNFEYLGAIDVIGLRYNIKATNIYGGVTEQKFAITIQGISEGIIGQQTISEATNVLVSAGAVPRLLFSNSQWLSASGSEQAQSITVSMQDWDPGLQIYVYQSEIEGRPPRNLYRASVTPDAPGEIGNGFIALKNGEDFTITRADGNTFDVNELIENLYVQYFPVAGGVSYSEYMQSRAFHMLLVDDALLESFRSYLDTPSPSATTPQFVIKSIVDKGGVETVVNDVSTITVTPVNAASTVLIDTRDQDEFPSWFGIVATPDLTIAPYTNHIQSKVELLETGFTQSHPTGPYVYQVEGKFGTLRVETIRNDSGSYFDYEFIPNAEAINQLSSNTQETFYLHSNASLTFVFYGVNDAPALEVETLSPIYQGNAEVDEWEQLFSQNSVFDPVEADQRVRGLQIEIKNIQHGSDERLQIGQSPVVVALNKNHSGTTTDGLNYDIELVDRTERIKTQDDAGKVTFQDVTQKVAIITLDKVTGITPDDLASVAYQHLGSDLNGDRTYVITKANESIGPSDAVGSWYDIGIQGAIVDFSFMIEDLDIFLTDNPGADIFGTIEGNLAASTGEYNYQLQETVIDGKTYSVGTVDREGVTYQSLNSPYGQLQVDPLTGHYFLVINSQVINDIETGTPDENQVSFNVSVNDPKNPRYGSADFQVNVKVDASPEAGALYVEQDSPDTLLKGISLYSTRPEEFDVRYFDISIPESDENVNLLVPNSPVIDTTLDAISFQDNKVYLGRGEGRFLQIGRVDTVLDGRAGKTLRVIMEQQVVNGNFAEYSEFVPPVVQNGRVISAGTEPVFPGWELVTLKSLYPKNHGTSGIAGKYDPLWEPGKTVIEIAGESFTVPQDTNLTNNLADDSGKLIRSDGLVTLTKLYEMVRTYAQPTEMGLNLINYTDGGSERAIYRHSYVVSDPIAMVEGSSVKFDYYLGSTNNNGDLLAYILNLNTGEWSEIENYSGTFDNGLFAGWYGSVYDTRPDEASFRTAELEVPADGRYSIVIVSGTVDFGKIQFSDVFIKDVKVEGRATIADNSLVQRVIEEIRYENTSDLTAENGLQDKSLVISVQNFDGSSDQVSMDFEAREVNDAPVALNPNQIVDITDTVNWDNPSVSGSFDVVDPDANTVMRYYSVNTDGSEIVDVDGNPKPLVGRYGTLSFGGAGSGWTYNVDPFAFNALAEGQVVNEVFANLQGSDGDGGIVNLTLTFRLAGAADEAIITIQDTSAPDSHAEIVRNDIFSGLSTSGLTYSIFGNGVVDAGQEEYVDTDFGRLYLNKSSGVVRYQPVSDPFNQAGSRKTVTFLINDGDKTGLHDLVLDVNGVNDVPIISGDDAFTYYEASGPRVLTATGTVSDAEQDWDGSSLLIDYGVGDVRLDGDMLRLVGDDILVNAGDVSVGGILVGAISAQNNGLNGAALEISFNANATHSQVQAVYQAIAFEQTTSYPSGKDNSRTSVSIIKTLDDGGHGTLADAQSVSLTHLVTIEPINNAPEVLQQQSIWETKRHVTDNPNGQVELSGLSIDDDGLAGYVTLSIDETHGTLVVATNVSGGLNSSNIAGNGTHSVRLTGTWEAVNATLSASEGIVFKAKDGVDIESHGAIDLFITATDTPQLTGNGSGSIVIYPADETGRRGDVVIIEDEKSTLDLRPFVSDINETASPTFELGTLSNGAFTPFTDLTNSSYGQFAPTVIAGVYEYTPPLDFAGKYSLAYRYTGDSGNPVEAPLNIYVVESNDAPIIDGVEGTSAEFLQGGNPVLVFSGADLSTYEGSQNISELRLRVAGVAASHLEYLELTGGVEIDLTAGETGTDFEVHEIDGDLEVILVGNWTVQEAEDLLNGLTYRTDQFAPAKSNRSISITSIKDDGGVVHNGVDTRTYGVGEHRSIIGVQMTLSKPSISLQTAQLDIVEDTAKSVDTGARIFSQAASELDDYAGHSLTIRSSLAIGQDVVSIGASASFTAQNGVIRDANDQAFASYETVDGDLVITFNSSEAPATQALVDAVTGAVRYKWVGETNVYTADAPGSASLIYEVANDADSDSETLDLSLVSVQDDVNLDLLDANQHTIKIGADWVNLYDSAKIDNPETFSGIYEATLTFSNIDDPANEFIRVPGIFSTTLEGGSYIFINEDGTSERIFLDDYPKRVKITDSSTIGAVEISMLEGTATVKISFTYGSYYAGTPMQTLLEGLQYKHQGVEWASSKVIDVTIKNLKESTKPNPFSSSSDALFRDVVIPTDWEKARVSLALPAKVSYEENGTPASFIAAFADSDFVNLGLTSGKTFDIGRMNSSAGITADPLDVFDFDASTSDRVTVQGVKVLIDNKEVGILSGRGTPSLSITMTRDVSTSDMVLLGQAVTYEINSEDPPILARHAWALSGTALSGAIDAKITPVDDAPTAVLTKLAQAVKSADTDYPVFENVSLSSIEATQQISSLQLEFRGLDLTDKTNQLIIGDDTVNLDMDRSDASLTSTNFSNVSLSYTITNEVGLLEFTGFETSDQAEELLAALRYRTTASASNTTLSTPRDIRLVKVIDTGATSNTLAANE